MTQPIFDEALKKNPRNVVIMLFDGMGVNLMEKHLPADSFLRTHMRTDHFFGLPADDSRCYNNNPVRLSHRWNMAGLDGPCISRKQDENVATLCQPPDFQWQKKHLRNPWHANICRIRNMTELVHAGLPGCQCRDHLTALPS
jgi:hypothetical protein